MKKILALMVALMMVFSLAGCGGSSAPAETEAPKETEAAETEAAGEEAEAAAETEAAGEEAAADDYEKYDDVTIRICMSGTEQGVDYISAEKYRDDLLEATGGRVKLELYASNILAGGSMAEAINMLTQGESFEMGIYSAAVLGNHFHFRTLDEAEFRQMLAHGRVAVHRFYLPPQSRSQQC